ncbi:MAG: GNAT family N-acetyltransferase [Flavobacteriaceae bacterium]|tara:strand:+ start:871 stop:1362 length:492 start_codon:yes stop_codon:yes gene_type:complete
MTNSDYIIREIEPRDNAQMKKIVQSVIVEMGAPKVGTAYEDKALEDLYTVYQKDKAIYFIVEYNGVVLGGGGIAALDNFEGNTCELQKMYFLPEARGKGLGAKMIEKCMKKAKEFGFEQCYLETLPYMTAAQKLYKKNGFSQIDGPMGNTCHYSCDVWMIRKL